MILGLDISMSCTGWSVIDNSKNIVSYGKIPTKKEQFKDEDSRMCYICDSIKNIIQEHNIKIAIIEDQFTSRNSKTILALRKLVGAIMRTIKLEGCEIEYMYPTSIRKYLLNDGKASKEKVADYIRKNIIDIGEYVDKTCKAKTSDIYDSIAAGVAYYNKINK